MELAAPIQRAVTCLGLSSPHVRCPPSTKMSRRASVAAKSDQTVSFCSFSFRWCMCSKSELRCTSRLLSKTDLSMVAVTIAVETSSQQSIGDQPRKLGVRAARFERRVQMGKFAEG